MKIKYLIGGIIIVLFIIWGASAFLKTTIRYVPIDEARVAEKTVQVIGRIDFDRVNYNTDSSRLEFAIYDLEALDTVSARRLEVFYYGVVPGNFEQATSVVLKGRARDSVFVADQLLVKCPSKYQGEEGDQYQDIRKHNQGLGESGI